MPDPVEGPATSTEPDPGGVYEDEDATRQGIDAADEAD